MRPLEPRLRFRPISLPSAKLLCCVALASTVTLTSTHAQKKSREDVERELQYEQQKRDDARRRSENLNKDVEALNADRARLNAKLIETAKLVQHGEQLLTAIEERERQLLAQEKVVRRTLLVRHATITKLLAAMQLMGRNPPPVMITERKDALEMVRSAMMLASVFPELRDKAKGLSDKLNELGAIMAETKAKAIQRRDENQRLESARTRLADLVADKRSTLEQRQAQLREVRIAANRHSRSVNNLRELISKLDKTVSEKGGLGAYNKELAEGRAPGQTKPASQASEQPTKPAIKLAPKSNSRVAMINPGRLKPAIPFAESRGSLPMPVSGKRIRNFGESTTYGTRAKGIAIQTRPQAQITSPSDGWVVFSGEFRSYGQLLIINAGGGYHVLLAGMRRIDASVGQFVLAGEPVGQMGGGSSNKQPAQGQKNILYVEFRRNEKPINPDPWWVKKRGKV